MKKLLALVLSVVLVFALAACGGTKDTATGGDAKSDSGEAVKLPLRSEFAAGPEWSVSTEPTKTNGPWAQS